MSARVCVCGHFEHDHLEGAGCTLTVQESRQFDVFCACRTFVLAGEQPALFGEDAS